MPEDLQFSKSLDTDIPELVKLVNSAYRGDTSKKGWTTEADLLDGIRTDEDGIYKMLHQPGAIILKCMSDNKLVGCVYLQKHADYLYLGMLTVSPELQAAGIGKELLKVSEEYARTEGCHSIKMTVITVRKELIQWYERRGYFQTEERQPFPNDPRFGIPKQPLEFLVMEKKLGDIDKI
ncbi:MAG TPA: GNAT family N-acetyltransferase [Flavisolibacter sp.]|nr:GNAT family N-acetyltransferase [Flavisolibacter sp.]